jgi:hypothetical protein
LHNLKNGALTALPIADEVITYDACGGNLWRDDEYQIGLVQQTWKVSERRRTSRAVVRRTSSRSNGVFDFNCNNLRYKALPRFS